MEEDNLIITELNKNEIQSIEDWISPNALLKINDSNVHIIAAIENDSLQSVMVAQTDEVVMNIIDIYTHEENRREHLAGTMLLEFVDYYSEMTDYALRYVVAEFDESNVVAASFYQALGFDIIKDETAKKMVYTLQNISESEALNKKCSLSQEFTLLRYSELDNIRRKSMYHQIEQAGGRLIDLFSENADDSLSYSLWAGDTLISMAELIINNHEIILGQFFIVQNNIKPVMFMLQTMMNELKNKYSEDTPFLVYITEEASGRLLTSILGSDGKPEYLMRAVLSTEYIEDDGGLIE